MDENLNNQKSIIRSILLAIGRRASVQEFLKEYKKNEGRELKGVLDEEFKMGFGEFIKQIPDVCRCWKQGNEIVIERVSTEESSHMDHFTIGKGKKKSSIATQRPTSRSVTEIPIKSHYAPKSLPLAPHQKMKPVLMNPEIREEADKEKIREEAHKEKNISTGANSQMPPRLCLSDPMRTFRL